MKPEIHGKPRPRCSAVRTITLNVPRQAQSLVADNGTLLHEMVHQHLNQIGEDATHASAAWRREIMRLHSQITGTHIWAGRSMVKRDPASKKVVRLNEPVLAALTTRAPSHSPGVAVPYAEVPL
jgi:hypothetical protein